MKVSAKLIYVPLFVSYMAGPLLHDVLPYKFQIGIHEVGALFLLYLAGLIIILPSLLLVKKLENKLLKLSPELITRLILGISLFIVPYILLWNEWSFFYIALALAMNISMLLMVLGRKDSLASTAFLKDKDTGNVYKIKRGKAYRLSPDEALQYQASLATQKIPTTTFSSSLIPEFDSNASEILMSYASSGCDFLEKNSDMMINPSTGLPMIGGIAGLDVQGNSWGTSFNEPSGNTSYDPNRGY